MDMSFHLNAQKGRVPQLRGGGPVSGLTGRVRADDGPGGLRPLSHIELMALVSARMGEGRMRHWQSEALLRRQGRCPMDARLALFAGPAARQPAWANSALGQFSIISGERGANSRAESDLDGKNEHAVYLGGSNIGKVHAVEPEKSAGIPLDESIVVTKQADLSAAFRI